MKYLFLERIIEDDMICTSIKSTIVQFLLTQSFLLLHFSGEETEDVSEHQGHGTSGGEEQTAHQEGQITGV